MSDCLYCDIVSRKVNAHIIYEDDISLAFLTNTPCSPGHIIVIPKKHYQIVEQVPDIEFGKLFLAVNKMSTIAFEVLGAKGTNVVINNGPVAGQDEPHVSVHIIPRQENDNLGLDWDMNQASESDLSDAELMLKEVTANIGDFEKESVKPAVISKPVETVEQKEGETNYLVEQLNRVP